MEFSTALRDLKERTHAARTEDRAGHELDRLDQILVGLEEGLYPVCVKCGARIEMDRLLKDPAELHCWNCGAHARGAQSTQNTKSCCQG